MRPGYMFTNVKIPGIKAFKETTTSQPFKELSRENDEVFASDNM